MSCNYDCDESPSLSSNDCLMKDVTVLICSGVDGLSIFVSFSSWFNSRKFEYIFWGTCTGAIRRLRFEIVNIEIMQHMFVIKHI